MKIKLVLLASLILAIDILNVTLSNDQKLIEPKN